MNNFKNTNTFKTYILCTELEIRITYCHMTGTSNSILLIESPIELVFVRHWVVVHT